MVGILLGLVVVGSACGASTEPSPWQAVWHSTKVALFQMECPSANRCVAAGEPFASLKTYGVTGQSPTRGFIALSIDGGAHWKMTAVDGEIAALACPTVRRCVGIVRSGTGSDHPLVSSDGGATWVDGTASPVLEGIIGLFCPSAMHCVGVANRSQYIGQGSSEAVGVGLWSTDGGMHWIGGQALGIEPLALSCGSVEHCAVVGRAIGGSPYFGRPMIALSADGGHSWHDVNSIIGPLPQDIPDVSCPTAKWCAALGSGYGTPSEEWLTTSDGGARWQSSGLSSNHSDAPLAIACPVPGTCALSTTVQNSKAGGTGLGEQIKELGVKGHKVTSSVLAAPEYHYLDLPYEPGLSCSGLGTCYAAVSGSVVRTVSGLGSTVAPGRWFVLRGGLHP